VEPSQAASDDVALPSGGSPAQEGRRADPLLDLAPLFSGHMVLLTVAASVMNPQRWAGQALEAANSCLVPAEPMNAVVLVTTSAQAGRWRGGRWPAGSQADLYRPAARWRRDPAIFRQRARDGSVNQRWLPGRGCMPGPLLSRFRRRRWRPRGASPWPGRSCRCRRTVRWLRAPGPAGMMPPGSWRTGEHNLRPWSASSTAISARTALRAARPGRVASRRSRRSRA
jgi:hypothetical protein